MQRRHAGIQRSLGESQFIRKILFVPQWNLHHTVQTCEKSEALEDCWQEIVPVDLGSVILLACVSDSYCMCRYDRIAIKGRSSSEINIG